MAKAVKLADIAVQLGVSTVTVSKALSGQKGVSEAMREKIKQLADELGYKQPSAARKEKADKSYNIGVLVSEKYLGEYASFYWKLYQSVATRAVQKECFTMLEVVSQEDEDAARLPKIVLEQKADGLIVIGKLRSEYLWELRQSSGIPVVYLDFYDEHQMSDAVISNSYYGTYMLTNYLFEKGLDKILKKVGEECTEVIVAAKGGSKEETVFEIADLAYHVMVLMVQYGIKIDDVVDELAKRHVVDKKVKQETMK